MRGQWIFKILSSLTCGSAFVTCFPFNFGVRKPHFHEGPAVRSDSFMVALPTRAYVEGVYVIIEVYRKFFYRLQIAWGYGKYVKQNNNQPSSAKNKSSWCIHHHPGRSCGKKEPPLGI